VKVKKGLFAIGAAGMAASVAAVGVSWILDHIAGESDVVGSAATPAVIARGAYLAKLGDCAACHSIPSKPPFSGGLRMRTPIGAIYTTNITPDSEHGIGSYRLSDFDRALRFGVAGGHTLYPAMPFTSYRITKPEDVASLYAYFKHGVTPAAVPNRPNDILFPLSMRWPLTYWRWLFAPTPAPFTAPAGMKSEEATGAYIVDGLGHCGECHTSRAFTMQLKASTAADGSAYLAGAEIDNYFAPSLRSGGHGTVGEWSAADLAQFLQTGANARGIAFGSMSDVVTHSTQYMTPEDAVATAKYLKTLGNTSDTPEARFLYDERDHHALKSGDASKPGAMLYLDNCAACHRPDGMGYERVFPRLAGNEVVQAQNSLSVIAIVLEGSRTPRTRATPAQFTMPAFARRLSDQEVADVVNFVRTSWGNQATTTSAKEVSRAHRSAR
jgi:mono/diheme cytochrome c family protein